MRKFYGRGSALLFSTVLLAANANSQNTKDITFSKSQALKDSIRNERTNPKYEWGIGAGISVYQGDLGPTEWGAYKSVSPAVQAHISRLFSPAFALRANATFGQFKADDLKSASKEPYRDYRRYNFKTTFAELSAMLQWTPFAKANWRLNPYVMGGAGVSFVNVKNDWSKIDYSHFRGENLPERLAEDEKHSHNFPTLVLPIGLGFKYDIRPKTSLSLEWMNRVTVTDYLDGFSKAGNSGKNDRYSTIMLSLNFRFGKNKKSTTTSYTYINNTGRQESTTGITNNVENKSSQENSGRKPAVANDVQTQPERKPVDATTVQHDESVALLKDVQTKLVELKELMKANSATLSNREGLTLLKGVQDELSTLTTTVKKDDAALADDDSKALLQNIQNKLNPLIKRSGQIGAKAGDDESVTLLKDIQKKLNLLMGETGKSTPEQTDNDNFDSPNSPKYIVYFDFAKYNLDGEARRRLDEIAALMKADPKLGVELKGFTDVKGNNNYNMTLSKNRSAACKNYLRSKGISAGRIKTAAYGKSNFVVDDASSSQQWKNRRVEVFFN